MCRGLDRYAEEVMWIVICRRGVDRFAEEVWTGLHKTCGQVCRRGVDRFAEEVWTGLQKRCGQVCRRGVDRFAEEVWTGLQKRCGQVCRRGVDRCPEDMLTGVQRCGQVCRKGGMDSQRCTRERQTQEDSRHCVCVPQRTVTIGITQERDRTKKTDGTVCVCPTENCHYRYHTRETQTQED